MVQCRCGLITIHAKWVGLLRCMINHSTYCSVDVSYTSYKSHLQCTRCSNVYSCSSHQDKKKCLRMEGTVRVSISIGFPQGRVLGPIVWRAWEVIWWQGSQYFLGSSLVPPSSATMKKIHFDPRLDQYSLAHRPILRDVTVTIYEWEFKQEDCYS